MTDQDLLDRIGSEFDNEASLSGDEVREIVAQLATLRAALGEACEIAESHNVRGRNDYDEADERRIVELLALATGMVNG